MRKLTRKVIEEAEIEVINDIIVKFQMNLFEAFKKISPEMAAGLRKDYEEYLQKLVELQHHTKGDYSERDLAEALPNNRWTHFMKVVRKVMEKEVRLDGKAPRGKCEDALDRALARKVLKIDLQ